MPPICVLFPGAATLTDETLARPGEGAFRELSPRELGHSRVEENGLPPCLTVCVCDRYEDRGAFPSICVGKCEGIGVRRNRESPTRVAWLASQFFAASVPAAACVSVACGVDPHTVCMSAD